MISVERGGTQIKISLLFGEQSELIILRVFGRVSVANIIGQIPFEYPAKTDSFYRYFNGFEKLLELYVFYCVLICV